MLDITQVFKNAVISSYESSWPILIILFIVGFLLFILRYEVTDTYREKRKLTEKAFYLIAFPVLATIGYLYLTGHLFFLLLLVGVCIVYFLYQLGLFPISREIY